MTPFDPSYNGLTGALLEMNAAIDTLDRRVNRLERRLLWMTRGSIAWAIIGMAFALGYAAGVRL